MTRVNTGQVCEFYEHAQCLEAVIDEHSACIRLNEGDAIVIDNQRVLHGRRAEMYIGARMRAPAAYY